MSADDIAQIMNEIEELQQEMNATAAPQKKEAGNAGAKAAEPAPARQATVTQLHPNAQQQNAPASAAPAAPAEDSAPMTDEDSILKEFSAGGQGEPSLEATMADLKDESESTGRGLLDDPQAEEMSPEPESTEIEDLASSDGLSEDGLSEDELSEEISEPIAEEDPLESPVVAEPDMKQASTGTSKSVEMTVQEEVEQMMNSKIEEDEDEVGTLAMSVKGRMAIQFNFQNNKESLTLKFGPDAIQIVFANGTEFKIPVLKD